MKNYEKPIAEFVEFQPEDQIMGVDIGGPGLGSFGVAEDWEDE